MYGKRLKELREKLNLTQEQLTEKLGIVRSTYSNYESEKREPDFKTVDMLAEFYDVSADYIMGRTNDPKRTLQPHSRKLIDLIDAELTDEDILKEFNNTFLIDGIPISRDEALTFIALIRTRRSMTKQQGSALDTNKV